MNSYNIINKFYNVVTWLFLSNTLSSQEAVASNKKIWMRFRIGYEFFIKSAPLNDEFINGVATRDMVIDPNSSLTVRFFIPHRNGILPGKYKLSLLLYFHFGWFCILLHFHFGCFCIGRPDSVQFNFCSVSQVMCVLRLNYCRNP